MLMTGRKYSAGTGYRYGFNGKENDNEVKGEGAQYDYGFRIYDPRLGKFLSVDPLTGNYPWYTPYQFAGNTPIQAIDLDGLEEAYPKQSSKVPLLRSINVSESTSQGNATRSLEIHRVQQQFAIEKLISEYQAWLREPGNLGKPLPSKYASVASQTGPQAIFKQGGYLGSDEYKISKARFDQGKEIIPGISDINDAYQAYEFGKKGQYGMMALSLASLVPGADFITKPLKFAGKYADEAARLIKQSGIISGKKEILTITKTGLRTDAYKVASSLIGDLGDNAIPLMGKSTSKYPDANKLVVGMQSADRSRGWRIDFDSEKGAHYNWFNNKTGEKGAVFFEGTADQVNYLKQQMTKTY